MADHTLLVVGGAGYIGSHMVAMLLAAGWQVIVLDDLSTGHRDLLPGGTLVEGNLGDAALLDRIFAAHPIDAVMHFAAFSLVGESVAHPLKYYRNNLARTVTLLEAMVRHRVRRFIFSSTAAVYGEPEEIPIAETHPCRPTNPYGATKIGVERMLADCDQAHGLKSVSLRYFNAAGAHASGTMGERHNPESHLIPLVLQVATGERQEIKIFGTDYPTGDGTCLRDYVHVDDLARAHMLALEALLAGEGSAVYNLGNSRGYSVREVIETARRVTGRAIPVVETERRPGDPAVLVAASEKIRGQLGWQPRYEELSTIIATAWRWHQAEAARGTGRER
ncbi:MAG: UDP-glucose 4-epimerase GalE [Desulfobulbaceae bacterium]|nr:UDP-glucose 4-epimerase GalE [Desulfobulbaceae bacterium]